MKHKLFLLLMVLGFKAVSAQTSPNALVFEMKDGTSATYLFEELPMLSFTAEDIVVKTHLYETSHPQNAVQRYVFTYFDPTGISTSTLDGFSQMGNLVSIKGVAAGTTISVYTTDGKLLQSVNANSNGTATVSLEQFPIGVYLVKYNHTTIKIKRS